MIRTANIEVSLQRLSILRIEHPQANPLKLACTLRAGEALPSGLTITAEIHTSRNVAAETAPLASSSVTVAVDATSFEVLFDSPQTNQTVTPDSTRALWLVVYGVGDSDQLYTFAAADLLLGWHAISTLTADPPATSILVEKGGVAWASGRQYVSGTVVTVGTAAYVCTTDNTSTADDQPGVGQEWESFWVVLSGGVGGATNLGATVSPTQIVITSDTGNDATIPAADGTNAGLMLPAQVTKLAGIQAGAEVNVNADWNAVSGDAAILNKPTITNGTVTTVSVATANGVSGSVANATTTPAITLTLEAITPTSVNGITLSGSSTPTLAVTGTTAVSGTNTGNVTLSGQSYLSITGQAITAAQINLTTHVTGDLPLANLAQASAASRLLGRGSASGAGDYQEISIGSGLSMSGATLSATATGGGTNTILQFFPKDAEFPSTGFATIDTRNNHPCLDYADSGTETAFFTGFIPQGASFAASGTALTFVLESTATSATTGNIGWNVALERIVAGGIDIDADAFGTAQSGSAAVSGTSGVVSEVTVTFTLAQLPSSLAAGDQIRVRVQRNTAVGSNHSGDAELLGLYANMTPDIP